MNTHISMRDIVLTFAGTVLGGIFVYLISQNYKLTADNKILESSIQTTKISESARVKSEEALKRADTALRNVQNAEKEANRILDGLKAKSLFKEADEKMQELRELAERVAKEETKVSLKMFKENSFKRIKLNKRDHSRNSEYFQAFVQTDSIEKFVLCQAVTAIPDPEFIKQIYCQQANYGNMEGIQIHVQIDGDPPPYFEFTLLVYQNGAKRYGTPVFLG